MGIHKRGKVPASNQQARKIGPGYTEKASGNGDQLGIGVKTLVRQGLQSSYPDIVAKSEKGHERTSEF